MSCVAVFELAIQFLNPLTLLVGPGLVIYLCVKSGQTDADGTVYRLPSWNVILSWLVWLQVTRAFKLLPHLARRPRDVFYVPVWVLFGYVRSLLPLQVAVPDAMHSTLPS